MNNEPYETNFEGVNENDIVKERIDIAKIKNNGIMKDLYVVVFFFDQNKIVYTSVDIISDFYLGYYILVSLGIEAHDSFVVDGLDMMVNI